MADKKKDNKVEGKVRTFTVKTDFDIVKVRECARDLADEIGFSTNERTLIATAVSEVCRNVIEYARNGEITIVPVHKNHKTGLTITVEDQGPGIEDLDKAMTDGYSTGRGMGVGLPGTKRIMDDFHIQSEPGKGTRIVMSKWVF